MTNPELRAWFGSFVVVLFPSVHARSKDPIFVPCLLAPVSRWLVLTLHERIKARLFFDLPFRFSRSCNVLLARIR